MKNSSHPVAASTFWNRAGIWLAYACAVHCALMPFLIGYLSLNGMGWIATESTEWSIIIVSLGIGLLRLSFSYFKEHRKAEPVLLFLCGVCVVCFAKGILVHTPQAMEPAGTVAGCLMMGTAHFRNQAKCKFCTHAANTNLLGSR